MLSQKIDQYLISLAWSLWTEIGVAGVKRKHQQYLIAPEELILLTAVIAHNDPRLRDEALDWCCSFHEFISVSRLKTLAKEFEEFVSTPYSKFSASVNGASEAKWPIFSKASPIKIKRSKKSTSPRCELPALLYFRLRSLFGVGARADTITFFLTKEEKSFPISDLVEIGYVKRGLNELLNSLVRSGAFGVFKVGNQHRYRLIKHREMALLVGSLPKFAPPWKLILEVLLPIRACVQKVEKKPEGVQVIEVRNVLLKLEDKLLRLNLNPPIIQPDFRAYLDAFSSWIFEFLYSLSDQKSFPSI